MRLLILLNPSVEKGIWTQLKRDGMHASLTLLLVRDKRLTSQSGRRSIMLREISVGRLSERLLFDGLMVIMISAFESVHLYQDEGQWTRLHWVIQEDAVGFISGQYLSTLSSLVSAAPTCWDDI